MALPYQTPRGGTRGGAPVPAAVPARTPIYVWRQPVGGVRTPPPSGR